MSESSRLRRDALGEHDVVRVIARGGMGSVFEVKNRRTGVSYAAKTILKAGDQHARDRFRREAELLARVDKHPGVVKVHAYGETSDGNPYMILDLVQGDGLDRILEREGRLAPRRAAELARGIAEALGFVHGLGVVHRDVKPSNVLMAPSAGAPAGDLGTPKLTDFGLATARDVDRLTRTGVFLGTFAYSAPEQATAALGLPSPRADVFGLGAVLFHMLTGETPIQGDSPLEILAKLASPEPVRDVRLLAPGTPASLAGIVARALAKDPARRFADGDEMALDLAAFLAGRPTSSSIAFHPPLRARRRVRFAAAGLAALLAVGAGVALAARAGRSRHAHAALERAQAATDETRKALARAGRASGKAAEPEAERALEQARLAVEQALEAAPLGSPEAASVASAAAAALGEARTACAEVRLANGAAASALEILSLPPDGGPASLPLAGHLARARALVATRRLPEAAAEAELVLEGGGPLRADAAEVLGDARLLQGEAARAATAFTRALELGPRRPTDVRAKRGSAAARAADDRTALADLAVLAPDLAALPAVREENARLAGLAPALYRRGLATEGAPSDRDLEAAWRLAPPPPDLAPRVVERWLSVSLRESDAWAQRFVGEMLMDQTTVERLRTVFRRVARARAVDPACDVRRFWDTYALLRNWVRNTDPGIVERVAHSLAAEWPDQPIFDYMTAAALRKHPGPGNIREALAIGFKAAAELPPPEPDEHADVRRLATYICVLIVELSSADGVANEVDAGAIRTLCERSNYADSWLALAHFELLGGRPDSALDALEHTAGMLTVNDNPVREEKILRERVVVLCSCGRVGQAIDLLDALPPDQAVFKVRLQALILCRAKRWVDVLAAVDPSRVSDDETLLYAAESLAELGRLTEARAVQARLERAGSDVVPELRAYLDRIVGRSSKDR